MELWLVESYCAAERADSSCSFYAGQHSHTTSHWVGKPDFLERMSPLC
jgi:hypothetical protein